MRLVSLACITLISTAAACIPVHDYDGTYDMTYDVILRGADGKPDARAGTAPVVVKDGPNQEFLVDLGPSFCRLHGTYVKAELVTDWPYLDIRPQDCWFTGDGGTLPMSVAGTATFGEHDERFSIVLTGNITDADRRATATIEFTESW
jgi:hypothetical protein